jgi:hypothetical protein
MFSRRKKDPGRDAHNWHPSELIRPRNEPLVGGERLLPSVERSEATFDCDDETMARLDEAIATASTYLSERWTPTTSLINPLLEVWEAAHAIHPAVARPVEGLLPTLIHRTTVTPAEITAMADEVRVLALQASVLVGGTKVS